MIIKHKVNVQNSCKKKLDSEHKRLIIKAITGTLENEGVDSRCVVNILITDDKGISEFNREYRDIDKATDVLSFPMQTFWKEGWTGHSDLEFDEDTGELPLGDIVISIDTVIKHAADYGNTVEYESVYMLIHSALHLLGYDHINECGEKAMQQKQDAIIKEMGFEKYNDK